MKILVVEESPGRPHSLRAELAQRGYAADGISLVDSGAEIASPNAYDVIVIDLVATNSSARLLAHEYREAYPEAKILILSPSCDTQDRITTLIQGADEILVKPFDLAGLEAVLRDAGEPGDSR